ncbi:MAG: tetratricopeptide repeat protein, partial [Candidatus Omnitrophota bacterium]
LINVANDDVTRAVYENLKPGGIAFMLIERYMYRLDKDRVIVSEEAAREEAAHKIFARSLKNIFGPENVEETEIPSGYFEESLVAYNIYRLFREINDIFKISFFQARKALNSKITVGPGAATASLVGAYDAGRLAVSNDASSPVAFPVAKRNLLITDQSIQSNFLRLSGERFLGDKRFLGQSLPQSPYYYYYYTISAILAHLQQGHRGIAKDADIEEQFIGLLKENNIKNILEIGTPDGALLRRLLNVAKKAGVKLYGLDLRVGPANQKDLEGIGIALRNGDASDLNKISEFEGVKFDLIYCIGVLDPPGQTDSYFVFLTRRSYIEDKCRSIVKSMLNKLSDNAKSALFISNLGVNSLVLKREQMGKLGKIIFWREITIRGDYHEQQNIIDSCILKNKSSVASPAIQPSEMSSIGSSPIQSQSEVTLFSTLRINRITGNYLSVLVNPQNSLFTDSIMAATPIRAGPISQTSSPTLLLKSTLPFLLKLEKIRPLSSSPLIINISVSLKKAITLLPALFILFIPALPALEQGTLLKLSPAKAKEERERPEVFYKQGWRYLDRAQDAEDKGDSLAFEENLRNARRNFYRALHLSPRDPKIRYYIGITYYLQGYLGEAITNIHKALELGLKEAKAYNTLGIAYYESGKHRNALLFFNKAIKLDSQIAAIYLNRSFTNFDLGDYQGALNDLNKACRLDFKLKNKDVVRNLLRDIEEEAAGIKIFIEPEKLGRIAGISRQVRSSSPLATYSIPGLESVVGANVALAPVKLFKNLFVAELVK